MSADREFDIIVYGASGFTGAYIVEEILNSAPSNIRFAVAGRSEKKISETLKKVGEWTDRDLSKTPIIIADSSSPDSLTEMARRGRVIINAVGPFRLYGEAVVKAAAENGTSHVDISGEPLWLEEMQLKYNEKAVETGAVIVGACGWDSIPCDLGVNFMKNKFGGKVAHVETFADFDVPEGYQFNAGTYQTILLGLSGSQSLGALRRKLMPVKLPKPSNPPPKRGAVWKVPQLNNKYAIIFPGADKSVVSRSQYHQTVEEGGYPIPISCYFMRDTWCQSVMTLFGAAVLFVASQFGPTRRFCQNHPEFVSRGFFSNSGPKRELTKKATFTYYVRAIGWDDPKAEETQKPEKRVTIRCDGPDAGYIGTSKCVLGAALTILAEKEKISKQGGVFTPTSAFANTSIYDRLATMGVTFRIDEAVGSK